MDYSSPAPLSMGSSKQEHWSHQSKDWTWISCVSCFGRQILYHWATWEAPTYQLHSWNLFHRNQNLCSHKGLCTIVSSSFVHGSLYGMVLRKVKVAQSCLTLCDSMDYTVHGILQARTPVWVAIPFSRGSSQPRDQTRVSWIVGGFFTNRAIREDLAIRETALFMGASMEWYRCPSINDSNNLNLFK